jgi:cyclopropane fatty-acyl-phospholipid synthase-like methyltransferase
MSEIAAVAHGYDSLYKEGRYQGEPPVAFVDTVLEELSVIDGQGYGLYVGCGNGRNYLPLFQTLGSNLRGVDVSPEGIRQLREQEPATEKSTFVGDFSQYMGAKIFRYIISIQAFQHGDLATTNEYFRRSAQALQPSGKLFLRVNSSSTNLIYPHRVNSDNTRNSSIVTYKEGPKAGQTIRYYSKSELSTLANENGFSIITPLVEVTHHRQSPLNGKWVQWESVWQKGESTV